MKIEKLDNGAIMAELNGANFLILAGETLRVPNPKFGEIKIASAEMTKDFVTVTDSHYTSITNLGKPAAPTAEPTRTTETQEKIKQIQKLIEELPRDEDRLEATGTICHHCGALNGGDCYCMRDD